MTRTSLLFSLEFLQEVGFARQHCAIAGISTLTELVVLLLFSIEILSFISFDIRLIQTMIHKRMLRPMPIAYLTARYSLLIGLFLLCLFTLPLFHGRALDHYAVHWSRPIFMPLNLIATSAVLGYRALVIHFERLRPISLTIHLLLAAELIGGILITLLADIDPNAVESHPKLSPSNVYVSPAWICAPLVIAVVIDVILTLIVVVPILRQGETPKKGDVIHMLLSDATFFGIFSIAVKLGAIGCTVMFAANSTILYLPVRVANVASTIFACKIFRRQEVFLQLHRERKAEPSLRAIELRTIEAGGSGGKRNGKEGDEKEGDERVREVRRKASVSLTEMEALAGGNL